MTDNHPPPKLNAKQRARKEVARLETVIADAQRRKAALLEALAWNEEQ